MAMCGREWRSELTYILRFFPPAIGFTLHLAAMLDGFMYATGSVVDKKRKEKEKNSMCHAQVTCYGLFA